MCVVPVVRVAAASCSSISLMSVIFRSSWTVRGDGTGLWTRFGGTGAGFFFFSVRVLEEKNE